MSLPRYPEYKDSGVEWLGAIPGHWEVRKFRHSFSESSEKIEGEVVGPMLSVSGYRGIEVKDYDDENRRRTDQELQGYRIVRHGQLVVNTMWLNYAGLGVSAHEGHVSPAYRAYWICADLEPRFVHHMMRCGEFVKGYSKFLTGVRPNSLQMSREDLMEFRLAEPSRPEQVAIAKFLDRETARIDALIAEQEKLLALLAEKRLATISHAVTRGLDPNVPMKDSGIPWLGEVPAHWEVMQLRNIARIVRGASPRPAGDPKFFANDDGQGSVPWLTVAEITKDESLYVDEVREYLTALGAEHSQRFEKGTVVFSNSGATLGVPKILGIDCCANDGVLAFRELSPHVDPEYLYCFLLTTTQRLRTEMKQGGGQPNLNTDIVKGIGFACPPTDEQSEIVAFLHGKFRQFESLKHAAEQSVALLSERRSALISAAVTGKVDVRGMVEVEAM
ncbi:restriction endonuclease subunit S [uncultured Luteimonas sp.]|uniref:restriction endonuclease subunit S n=1 Tax=uncultured Luteimonas sp. TaxID=453144 RepID=UPI002602527F|nr:restriction endonuclease subunit S [uncultured Luteimonas sp.]